MQSLRDLPADLEWLVERIRDEYEPEKIILFGSLARGNTHEWSDIDLIVVKDTEMSYGERVKALLPVLRGWRGGADILVYSLEEYERARKRHSAFLGEAEAEGITLYERR